MATPPAAAAAGMAPGLATMVVVPAPAGAVREWGYHRRPPRWDEHAASANARARRRCPMLATAAAAAAAAATTTTTTTTTATTIAPPEPPWQGSKKATETTAAAWSGGERRRAEPMARCARRTILAARAFSGRWPAR